MRQRPISILIFGILNIGYGLFKLAIVFLGAIMTNFNPGSNPAVAAMKSDPTYVAMTRFNMSVGAVLDVAVLTFGIGLLLMQNWARIGSIVYALIDIVVVVAGTIVGWPMVQRMIAQQAQAMPRGGAPQSMVEGIAMVSMVVGLVLSLIYPILLLIFMTRQNVIEACQPEAVPPPDQA